MAVEIVAALYVLLLWVSGIFTGMLLLTGYLVYRGVTSDGWDDSNVFNMLRLLAHAMLHPEDFLRMVWVRDTSTGKIIREPWRVIELPARYAVERPFYYLAKDEFEGVVDTRPDWSKHDEH